MWRKAGFILALVTAGLVPASLAPALAQSTICTEPVTPTPVDGNTVTQTQLVAALAAVKDFQARSDAYQDCLRANVDAQKADAIKNNTVFDTTAEQTMVAKVAANQQAKEQAVRDVNNAVGVFKQKAAK
jgi:hypothetical protein